MNALKSLRDVWTFSYTAGTVAKAAAKREAHHLDRLDFWKGKINEVEQKIKDTGIDFSPRVRAGRMSNTAYMDQPTIDTELLMQHREAQERVDHHTELADRMHAFASVLGLEVHERSFIDLTVEDVRFFHLDEA